MTSGGLSRAGAPPDDPVLADSAGALRAAYVHIPFCARRCPYCDFAVVTGRDDLVPRYTEALLREIEMEPPWHPLDAVYFGGGTPSRVPWSDLGLVIGALRDRFGLNPRAEISLEANPEDWTPDVAEGFAAAGCNRVSLGAQSLDPRVLAALERRHHPDQVVTAVNVARGAGFVSVNLDLIFGTPGETLSSWRATVERALELQPDHLSAYALTVELGTPLSRAVADGAAAPDPDLQADQYEFLQARCGELVRYEVSNWARPGHTCLYNLITWAQGEYLAFGIGAHGHRAGVRRRNVRRLDTYLQMVAGGARPEQGSDRPDDWGREQERLLVGIRRTAGVAAGRAGRALVSSAWGRRLLDAGVIVVADDRLRVAKPLLTDEVSRAVLALQPGEC